MDELLKVQVSNAGVSWESWKSLLTEKSLVKVYGYANDVGNLTHDSEDLLQQLDGIADQNRHLTLFN